MGKEGFQFFQTDQWVSIRVDEAESRMAIKVESLSDFVSDLLNLWLSVQHYSPQMCKVHPRLMLEVVPQSTALPNVTIGSLRYFLCELLTEREHSLPECLKINMAQASIKPLKPQENGIWTVVCH